VSCMRVRRWVYGCSSDKGRTKIGKTGGITYVIAAMTNHARSARVQEQACAAIWNLSASGTAGPLTSLSGAEPHDE
jgi:hypothetical protein